jgi:hypothetical protein
MAMLAAVAKASAVTLHADFRIMDQSGRTPLTALARDFDPREIGLLYYAMASSQTLGDALKRVARYSQITNEALVRGTGS